MRLIVIHRFDSTSLHIKKINTYIAYTHIYAHTSYKYILSFLFTLYACVLKPLWSLCPDWGDGGDRFYYYNTNLSVITSKRENSLNDYFASSQSISDLVWTLYLLLL